jgi:hypothetical protein
LACMPRQDEGVAPIKSRRRSRAHDNPATALDHLAPPPSHASLSPECRDAGRHRRFAACIDLPGERAPPEAAQWWAVFIAPLPFARGVPERCRPSFCCRRDSSRSLPSPPRWAPPRGPLPLLYPIRRSLEPLDA